MDGIVLINKEKGITSRDVVNIVSKNLKIKRVGHAGTLDPLATGLMVIGIGKATKVLELLTLDTKEYIATVKIGIQTDTLDITGNIVNQNTNYHLDIEDIKKVLNKYVGSYEQTVPKYSAVKINGKRLYEYARNNIEVELPKRIVNIYEIELLSCDLKNKEFKFRTLVSKGCYIRSLIDDIGKSLNIPMTMKELIRTKSGKFNLCNANNIKDKYNIIKIQDALDFKIVKVTDDILLKKIKNGNIITLNEEDEYISLIDTNNQILAIYKKFNNFEFKAFKVF